MWNADLNWGPPRLVESFDEVSVFTIRKGQAPQYRDKRPNLYSLFLRWSVNPGPHFTTIYKYQLVLQVVFFRLHPRVHWGSRGFVRTSTVLWEPEIRPLLLSPGQ